MCGIAMSDRIGACPVQHAKGRHASSTDGGEMARTIASRSIADTLFCLARVQLRLGRELRRPDPDRMLVLRLKLLCLRLARRMAASPARAA